MSKVQNQDDIQFCFWRTYDGVKGIDVIPCFYKLEYIEWKDRGEGIGAPLRL